MPASDSPDAPPAADPSWEEVEAELGDLVATATGIPLALPAADPATWEAVEQELGDLVLDFQDLQDDLHYRRAQAALGSLVQRLNLTPREQAGVEDALENLKGLIDKLEHTVVHIAAFGLVGRGKSSLLNALLGQEVFTTGPTHGVTQVVEGSRWAVSRDSLKDALGEGPPDLLRVSLKSLGQSRIELIDTPGLDEVDGADRAALARRVAEQVDLILFVIAGDITWVEYEALQALRQASKPMLLVFNKIDQYPEADRQTLYETLRDRRLQDLISPDEIVMAAASPLAVQATPQPNGTVTYQTVRAQPQVDDLKLKILDLLHREGKALVALNTLMYAEGVSGEILARKKQICDRIADDTIWNATLIKAVAVALNPITVADLVGGTVIDVMLILNLSRLYGLPMTRPAALKLLQQIALGLGGITLSELAVTLGLSSLKGMLGVSAIATGGLSLAPYVPVALAQGGVAGLATYSIGQITKTYLTNGATWGPEGPKTVIAEILDSLDETSILNRIKAELRAKIAPPE
ncbi:GTP-binding protein [Nodosilinea nodulosa]|uniref:GTP-binding protein n=1 Tax=Nodosilinea nodulosa TaxID=416001 RepID=UPI00031CF1B3|nr:GTP-binding protein [Nodosilinea nodulosa]